ncbi:ABC transporter substrate-binding protein [Frondihabitans sp. PAMC 28766]|uniref:ABC transporter substrate-binding protein n=1 Tax=Frondihabitans sp. PAMC 28766 TaxID=1795630 RepID=UPI00078C48D6|nr:sugar ABC transporter substrate-binding protein [Frondihabitans sp. PAMC 28766]AMM21619.1 ABC transporter substrate-binding protein [Frondihabitans sp. PAMC 28766]
MSVFPQQSRRQRTRLLLGVAAAVAAVTALAGCSASAGGSTTSSSYTAPSKSTKANLTYAVWDQTQVKAIDANLVGFNKEYPNIKVTVNVTPFADYWTKLQTQASSNSLPDLFWMNGPNFQLYASNGKLAPITSEVKAGAITPSNYSSALDDLYTYKGTEYGVPKDFDTIGMWVNTALFKEAGVALPTKNWTWAEFSQKANAISTALKSKGIYGITAGMDGQTTYYPTIFQAGGSVVSANGKSSGYGSAATANGIDFWTNLIKSGASPNTKQLTDTTGDQWFTSGKSAMYQGGSWARSELGASPVAKSLAVYPLPTGKVAANVIHGVSNVVAAKGKNVAAAQALQVYLAGKAAQTQQGDLGAVIPAYKGAQTAFAKSMPGVDLQVFLNEVAIAKPLPVSKNTAAWNTLETNDLPGIFDGTSPLKPTLKSLSTQMTAALAKE